MECLTKFKNTRIYENPLLAIEFFSDKCQSTKLNAWTINWRWPSVAVAAWTRHHQIIFVRPRGSRAHNFAEDGKIMRMRGRRCFCKFSGSLGARGTRNHWTQIKIKKQDKKPTKNKTVTEAIGNSVKRQTREATIDYRCASRRKKKKKHLAIDETRELTKRNTGKKK